MPALKFLCALLLSVVAVGGVAQAATPNYPEGKFYTTINNPLPPPDPGKIAVQEFFWYGCPHCFHLDPLLNAWIPKLAKDVSFEHVPDNLGQALGKLHERAYYVATSLGIEHKIHTPLFDAIQVQRLPMNNKADLQAFFEKTAGVTAQQFDSAWNSFEVDSGMRRADQLALHDRILATPTLVIAGQYRVQEGLPGYMAMKVPEVDRFKVMLKVADYLIDKVRKDRAAGK
ncbi:MAG TPA: thiol:disulfide interchange protein DsbA/DsbL [Nevskiaceae bacterium]|nr:thiol:disulfide interchange protein DsbA/DsbL [Nevskiaceae bacterium]